MTMVIYNFHISIQLIINIVIFNGLERNMQQAAIGTYDGLV